MTCYIFNWTQYILDVLHIKQLDELFQILNLFEKDLNLKGLKPHWNNITISSSRQGVSATCSSAPGSSRGAVGSSGQGPGQPKQEVAHFTMVVSDDDEFADDPHQIIPTKEVFTVPAFP